MLSQLVALGVGLAVAPASGHTGAAVELRLPASRSIWVPPGRYTAGATTEQQAAALELCKRELGALERACSSELVAGEGPPHEVFLPGYFLDRQEVTVGAYRRCVDAGRCDPRPLLEADPRFTDARLPVTNVSWFDAERYCAFVGARLPTELQWERAARGPTRRIFPWGDEPRTDRSNHGRFQIVSSGAPSARPFVRVDETDGYPFLSPPGAFPAGTSPEGFVDMAGNVAEWVAEAVGEDGSRVANLSTGAPRRMIRGGSFRQPLLYQRTTAFDAAPPELRSPEVGFRCASGQP